MRLKRITIPYETKMEMIKKLENGEISYKGLTYQDRTINKHQVARWKKAIEQFELKSANLRAAAVSAIKVSSENGPSIFRKPEAPKENIEVLKLKATLCDALLKVNQLEQQISQKFIDRRGNNMRAALNH
jgi:hypothetical protein